MSVVGASNIQVGSLVSGMIVKVLSNVGDICHLQVKMIVILELRQTTKILRFVS